MAQVSHFSPRLSDDARPPVPYVGDERELLIAFLDHYRDTFSLKCHGLADAQLSSRSVPPSSLSLHGLLRHLTGVEHWWFGIQFAGSAEPPLYYSDDDPDQDFDRLDGSVEEAWAEWRARVERSREIVASSSLEDTGTRNATGEPVSLRRIMIALIAEYARHCGHADLLRERIDGETGM